MIDFKKIMLSDKPWIDRLLHEGESKSADHCFANMYVWDDSFFQSVAEVSGRLVVKLDYEEKPFYAFPVGNGPLSEAIDALRRDSEKRGIPFEMRGGLKGDISELTDLYPGRFKVTPLLCDFDDYIYAADSLINLNGKKLHGKRNHISRFEGERDWHFEAAASSNLEECAKMAHTWIQRNSNARGESYESEKKALTRAFESFQTLGLEGGVLRERGEVIAFAIGEKLTSDTYIVHFEKAYSDIQGAYAMINREFAGMIVGRHPGIMYINRENDMGIESLRRAKRSYCPLFMVEKYSAAWI